MTEKSLLWDTNGTGDGTGTGFTETDMIQLFRSLFTRTANLGGVVPDFLNELAVTGTSSPVAINTGAALVYGIPYWNTASVNVAIATPAVSTRVDRIVLRADWTAQTVRITRIAGTEGAGTPAMTQSAGTTWDIPLATVSITTGGVITVTDAREWLLGTGDATIDSTKLATDAVTTAKIADSNVTAAKLASDAVTTAKILDSNVTNAKMADDAINTAKIVNGAVTAAKLADGAALAEILDDDGAGSGLDSDLLDGNHAAAFAAASHTHDPRTGLVGTNGVIADSANGDARGNDAVDLQTNRSSSTQVASGANSVVAGGSGNTSSGSGAVVAGGSNNTSQGADSFVGSGQNNVASGNYATIGGGDGNATNNPSATVGGGASNAADGTYSTIPGGNDAYAYNYGEFAYAGGQPLAVGNQMSLYVAGNVTTNNTQTTLYLDGATGTQRMNLESDSTWMFRAQIAARRTDADNESAAYEITGCIDNNAGTVALVGTITKTVIAEDNAGWDVTAEADNSNDALVIKVTGENAKTVRWLAVVYVTKVKG